MLGNRTQVGHVEGKYPPRYAIALALFTNYFHSLSQSIVRVQRRICFSYVFTFLFCFVWGHTGDTQGLLLILKSEITPVGIFGGDHIECWG